LYGHAHGKTEGLGKSMDVGVDCNDFKPVSFVQVVEIMMSKPLNINQTYVINHDKSNQM